MASDTKAGQPSPSREASEAEALGAGGTNPSSVSYCVTSNKVMYPLWTPHCPIRDYAHHRQMGLLQKLTGITQQRAWRRVTMPVMAIITAFLGLLFLSFLDPLLWRRT